MQPNRSSPAKQREEKSRTGGKRSENRCEKGSEMRMMMMKQRKQNEKMRSSMKWVHEEKTPQELLKKVLKKLLKTMRKTVLHVVPIVGLNDVLHDELQSDLQSDLKTVVQSGMSQTEKPKNEASLGMWKPLPSVLRFDFLRFCTQDEGHIETRKVPLEHDVHRWWHSHRSP